MLDQILEISKTHDEDYCNDIIESSYIQQNICKTEQHDDLTDMIISINDPNYQLLPVSEKSFYLKQKRLELGSEIEENKTLMEIYKFNNYLTIKKIQSGLMKKNSISSLLFLSEYYKCKITLIDPDKNIYCDSYKDFKTHLELVKNENTWSLGSMNTNCKVGSWKDIDGLIKDIISYDVYDIPLKNISSYKSNELQSIAKENGIDIKLNGKTKIKKVLYDELRYHLINLI